MRKLLSFLFTFSIGFLIIVALGLSVFPTFAFAISIIVCALTLLVTLDYFQNNGAIKNAIDNGWKWKIALIAGYIYWIIGLSYSVLGLAIDIIL